MPGAHRRLPDPPRSQIGLEHKQTLQRLDQPVHESPRGDTMNGPKVKTLVYKSPRGDRQAPAR